MRINKKKAFAETIVSNQYGHERNKLSSPLLDSSVPVPDSLLQLHNCHEREGNTSLQVCVCVCLRKAVTSRRS